MDNAQITAAYPEFAPMLAKAAGAFSEFPDDQYVSEAELAFVRACREYDPRIRGSLKGWVTYIVRQRLIDQQRADNNRRRLIGLVARYEIESTPTTRPCPVAALLAGVSADAAFVVRLLVMPTPDEDRRLGKCGRSPRSVWAMAKIMLQDMGWTARQIAGVHRELSEALT